MTEALGDGRRRIVFLDVDGTLTDHGILDPTAPDAIRAARAGGHLVFLSTGRAHGEISPDVLSIGFDGVISNGGSFTRLGDELLLSRPMSPSEVGRLLEFFDARNLPYFLQTDHQLYANAAMFEIFADFWAHLQITREATIVSLGLDPEQVMLDSMPEDVAARMSLVDELFDTSGNLAEQWHESVARAVFISPEAAESEEDTIAEARALLSDGFHIAPGSMPPAIGESGELSPIGVTKGSAIEALLDHLGLDPADAVGIGDSWNDVEMFDVCGVGVAMGNAKPEVAALADHVTAPVLHGGVRDALAHLGLI